MSESKPPKITEKDLTEFVRHFGVPPPPERKAKIMEAVRANERQIADPKPVAKSPAKKPERKRGREMDR